MEIFPVFKHALMISFFVFVMMLLVDFINIATSGQISNIMQRGRWRQYMLASFLGSTPGCLGAFMNVTLYVHGMISFGAIVGGMIATSGDEAFVMLAQFPGMALLLFGLLFVCGIAFAWISDKIIKITGVVTCESCAETDCKEYMAAADSAEEIIQILRPGNLSKNFQQLSFTRFLLIALIGSYLALLVFGILGPADWSWKRITFVCLSLISLYVSGVASEHYLHFHIWDHIIKKHMLRVFLWTFGALLFVHWGMSFWNLEVFVREHMIWILLVSALIGIIPESGPHLIFVMMYAQGLIPFSVLFTTSFVQDGHGMLPMLSYSIKDSILIKVFNLTFGIAIGAALFALGL
ncbi:MAG: putative manganese transporter [Thermodesulfobacteriota bacterium]|nr:putative manganese transporter [Thermodesulfobacteriota bacterium]